MAGKWNNGLAEALARMREHANPTGPSAPRFDARDRAALAYVLDELAAREPEATYDARPPLREDAGLLRCLDVIIRSETARRDKPIEICDAIDNWAAGYCPICQRLVAICADDHDDDFPCPGDHENDG